jgi:hypothetical protein
LARALEPLDLVWLEIDLYDPAGLALIRLSHVGPGHPAIIVSLVSGAPAAPSSYKARLTGILGLSHITVEVEACPGDHPHLREAA